MGYSEMRSECRIPTMVHGRLSVSTRDLDIVAVATIATTYRVLCGANKTSLQSPTKSGGELQSTYRHVSEQLDKVSDLDANVMLQRSHPVIVRQPLTAPIMMWQSVQPEMVAWRRLVNTYTKQTQTHAGDGEGSVQRLTVDGYHKDSCSCDGIAEVDRSSQLQLT